MKLLAWILMICYANNLYAQMKESPLTMYSLVWNQSIYSAANTADSVAYLTDTEKEVIYILSLVRMNPKLYNETVVKKYKMYLGEEYQKKNIYYHSLIRYLDSIASMQPLNPDYDLFASAECHAVTSGKVGYVGHARQDWSCPTPFIGECCEYGSDSALDIVMCLLIDDGVLKVLQ